MFPVTQNAMRPRDSERRCFYCHNPVGSVHESDCVLIQRRVQVRLEIPGLGASIDYEIEIPAAWTQSDVEFHRRGGSWCSDNALDELEHVDGAQLLYAQLKRYAELREESGEGCLCGVVTTTFVRDVPGPRGAPYLCEQ